MLNVLVTGGGGYIGSHTCKALSEEGFNPIVIDNLHYGHEWAVKWGVLIKGDFSDRDLLLEIFNTYKPIAVLHFAAFAYVGESVKNPNKYYKNNVSGSLNLLDVMNECSIKNIIFSSTCATYGIPKNIPISESEIQKPINPYGSSKLMIETIIKDFSLAYGLKYIILRYFNAAGADAKGEIGEDHDPETHLIPLTFRALDEPKKKLTIFGNDYKTADGTCIRDYIHVSDLANAHVLALMRLLNNKESSIYNLGNGKGYSVLEIINSVEKISNKRVFYEFGKRREGDPDVLIASAEKALNELKWCPKYSQIDEIIKTVWEWEKKRIINLKK